VSEPTELSPEELASCFSNPWQPVGGVEDRLRAHIAALTARAERAEADSAALVDLWRDTGCLDLGPRVEREDPSSCIEQGWPLDGIASCAACRALGVPHPGDGYRDKMMKQRVRLSGFEALLHVHFGCPEDASLPDAHIAITKGLAKVRAEALEEAVKAAGEVIKSAYAEADEHEKGGHKHFRVQALSRASGAVAVRDRIQEIGRQPVTPQLHGTPAASDTTSDS
jgi:hypothetical protein